MRNYAAASSEFNKFFFSLNFSSRWNFVVELIPLWVAPNLITIVGLAINVFTSLVHLYFCPTATEEVSSSEYSKKIRFPFWPKLWFGLTDSKQKLQRLNVMKLFRFEQNLNNYLADKTQFQSNSRFSFLPNCSFQWVLFIRPKTINPRYAT